MGDQKRIHSAVKFFIKNARVVKGVKENDLMRCPGLQPPGQGLGGLAMPGAGGRVDHKDFHADMLPPTPFLMMICVAAKRSLTT